MRALPLALALTGALVLTGCGKKGGGEGSEGAPAVATVQEALAQLPAPYSTGDLANGKTKFGLCRSCHTLAEGGPDGVGPNLYRVFGRKVGAKDGYAFSDAAKGAGFNWDAEHMDKWLTKPKDLIPGTKMTFAGMPDAKDRTDLIAYLKSETGVKKAQ